MSDSTPTLERLERQFANCSDSYEAPSGKIMFRIWANDFAALLKLARADASGNDERWQPIETAPKDAWILVFIPAEDDGMGRFHAARNRKVANGHSWIVGHHFGHDLAGEPTHWQPLPEPPAAIARTQEQSDG